MKFFSKLKFWGKEEKVAPEITPKEEPKPMIKPSSEEADSNTLLILSALKKHDERMQMRLEPLAKEESLISLISILKAKLGTNLDTKLVSEIETSVKNIEMTARLQQVLDIVKSKGSITPTELAKELGIKPPSAHALLDRLVSISLIRKVERGNYEVILASEETNLA